MIIPKNGLHIAKGVIRNKKWETYFLKQSNHLRTASFLSNVGLRQFSSGTDVIPSPSEATREDIRNLFNRWNSALATLDSSSVAKLYAEDGLLLPTVSDTPRTDFETIKDYFDHFLKNKPQGRIVDGHIKIGSDWAKDAGIYEFHMGSSDTKVKARYTFIYSYQDGEWKIAHHHSSAMPEQMIPKGVEITEQEVRNLFNEWNDTLATLDPEAVTKRYSSKSLLLPTVSDKSRDNHELIKDYFFHFLQNKPQAKILQSHVTTGHNWCEDAGIYEFTLGRDGSKVKARYSFVYILEGAEWKILHHHSSMMPEGMIASKGSLSDQVGRSLFTVWNNALSTLDSTKVAKLYSKNAVLLPTVSDTPRTTYEGIKDYFDHFLKLKPQGEIIESYVEGGDGWFKDVGVYEFKMGVDGSKVKARYSFVYVLEDGEWKISHHHSSAMPEQIIPKGENISDEEIRGLFKLWNDALATLEPATVAKRYSKNPLLLPTVSDIPRTDFNSIADYFVNFLKSKPQGKILESFVTSGPNWARDGGIYEFTMGKTGSKVKARYSFLYVFEDGEWKISHHHSSIMPESSKNILTESEAKTYFDKWNATLATGDSDVVANCYSNNSVLLPTVSDKPRTTYEDIKDYFDHFLPKKPQAEIIESHVTLGDGWFKDVGVYDFTMGIDGSKVKARYSFVYVFEDAEWKIAHHHSSAMPESLLAAADELAEIKSN